ncbi:MAG: hypothetical protein JW929_04115 [Anaerolineales bacterium]|nr:hypothetical protein [Anaerolineales bacterium]
MPRSNRIRRLSFLPAALIGLWLITLACSGMSFAPPTATPTVAPTVAPSATESPTATPTSTDTPTPTDVATPTPSPEPTLSYQEWPVVFSDTFDADTGLWKTGKSDNEYLTGDIAIVGGRYLVKISSKQAFLWRILAPAKNLSDFYVSADVKRNRSPEDSHYGLVFRSNDKQYYYYAINAASKQYAMYVYDKQWTTIQNWTSSSLIDPAGVIQLAALIQGPKFTLFLNGQEVNSFTDDTVQNGGVGIAVDMEGADQYLEIEFDNYFVRAPK